MFILIKLWFDPVRYLWISALIIVINLFFIFKCLVTSMSGVLGWNITKKILWLNILGRALRWTSNPYFYVINFLLLTVFCLKFPIIFWWTLFSLIDVEDLTSLIGKLFLFFHLKVFLIRVFIFPLLFEAVNPNAAHHSD